MRRGTKLTVFFRNHFDVHEIIFSKQKHENELSCLPHGVPRHVKVSPYGDVVADMEAQVGDLADLEKEVEDLAQAVDATVAEVDTMEVDMDRGVQLVEVDTDRGLQLVEVDINWRGQQMVESVAEVSVVEAMVEELAKEAKEAEEEEEEEEEGKEEDLTWIQL